MEKERRRHIIRVVVLTLFALGVLAFILHLDNVFGPVLFALLVAYILNPVVNWLQRKWLPRPMAIGLLFLAFYACFAAALIVSVPELMKQLHTLYQNTVGEQWISQAAWADLAEKDRKPWTKLDGGGAFLDENGDGVFDEGYVREVANWLETVRRKDHPSATTRAVAQGLEEIRNYVVENRRGAVLGAVDTLGSALFTAFGFLTMFVLVPIYLFYFLMGLGGIWEWTVARLPGRQRDHIVAVLGRIDDSLSAFFRGRLIVMVIKAIAMTLALWVVGLPYALFIGVVTGIGSLIPIAGFLMGVLPAVALALLDVGSPGLALTVAAIFIVVEVLENYLLTPWILKDRVGLHPMTIVISVFAAGALFGFVGMLLAVPIASIVKILFQEYVEPEITALAAESKN